MTMLAEVETNGPNLKGILDVGIEREKRSEPQRWVAGDSAEIPNGGRLVVDIGETSVGIFRVEDQLYAYLNICTHMGGPACQGKILPRVLDVIDDRKCQNGQAWDESDPHVVCPWHGFEYSIKTGEHAAIPSIKLVPVEVEESEGTVYVTL